MAALLPSRVSTPASGTPAVICDFRQLLLKLLLSVSAHLVIFPNKVLFFLSLKKTVDELAPDMWTVKGGCLMTPIV